ncbi:MAG: DNA primase [Planctomycetota bacterium]|nr:DNA primase [Planctomycetota bacterium]MDA0932283.1 DNA primase [Planctomycetota bacterium]
MDRFQEAKLLVKERVDLVDLIGGYVQLRRSGRGFSGLCPFHREKTPSFHVFPESQHYKCFGCGESGDVFTFVQEREGIGFREAMEWLADRAHVSLEGVFDVGGGGRARRQDGPDVHATLGAVRDLFEETLYGPDGAEARAYLEDRGLIDSAESFGLGLHPEAGRLSSFVREHKLSSHLLQQAGLLGRDGREPMAGRVMFPITDERGRIVGFGGRVLPLPSSEGEDRRPKYLNSPEAPFFNKRRLLYGLRQVKQAGERCVLVVEGYTDVIACHAAGFTGAVATLGTSLTRDHARLLERYATEGVVLLFDGDQAGRRAVDRAFRELVHTNLQIRIALLPEGRDPADLAAVAPGIDPGVVERSRDTMAQLVARADDALTVWFRLARAATDFSVPGNVARVAEECGRILAGLDSPARREAMRSRMALHLGLSPTAIPIPDLRSARRDDDVDEGAAPRQRAPRVRPTASPLLEADLDLLACVLAAPDLVSELGTVVGETCAAATRLLAWGREAVASGRSSPEAFCRDLFARCTDDAEARSFLADAMDRATRLKDPRGMFVRLRRDRELHFAKAEASQIKMLLKQAIASGDSAQADALTRKLQERLRRNGGAATV